MATVTLATDTPDDTLEQLNALGDGNVYIRTGEKVPVDPSAPVAQNVVTLAADTSDDALKANNDNATDGTVYVRTGEEVPTAAPVTDVTAASAVATESPVSPAPVDDVANVEAKVDSAITNVVSDVDSLDVPVVSDAAKYAGSDAIAEIHKAVHATQADIAKIRSAVEEYAPVINDVIAKLASSPFGKMFGL